MNLYPAIIDRLKTQHESLPQIIVKLNQTQLEKKPAPGKWSIKDNLAHLACYQPLFIARMHRVLEQDGVEFERYNADLDPEFPGWQRRGVDDLLNQLSADRQTIISLITNLQPQQLSRVGIHPKYGKLHMVDWAEFFLLHEAHHLFTIFQLVAR